MTTFLSRLYTIKVNLPQTLKYFKTGNGEGCFVIVDEETYKAYLLDLKKKNCIGILYNDSFEYPRFTVGTLIHFEMRGKKRPVANYHFLNDPTKKLNKIDMDTANYEQIVNFLQNP